MSDERQRIRSVMRASRMLLAVAGAGDGLTATEVASKLGLTLSTAYHLLASLEDAGLLAKAAGKHYVLGRGAVEIANSPNLRPRIEPAHRLALGRLAELTRETAYLTAWFRGDPRILATVEGPQAVRVAGLQVGYSGAVHARASSKLLLAFADDELRAAVLGACDFAAYTPETIPDRSGLDEELERIRRADIAYDRGEYREGVRSLSAPIRRDGAVVAALAVSAPADRFERTEAELVSTLRACAEAAAT